MKFSFKNSQMIIGGKKKFNWRFFYFRITLEERQNTLLREFDNKFQEFENERLKLENDNLKLKDIKIY